MLFKWMVKSKQTYYLNIFQKKNSGKKHGCGGILISSKFGITADHCIIGKKFSRDAIIFAGLYIWEDYDNQGVRIFL